MKTVLYESYENNKKYKYMRKRLVYVRVCIFAFVI